MLGATRNVFFACAVGVAAILDVRPAGAQLLSSGPTGFRAPAMPLTASYGSRLLPTADAGGTPSWVKWGLVGAAGGALVFGVLGESSIDRNGSVMRDAVTGAAIGFVVIGGAVAFYSWVCSDDSGSRRAGLCGS